jgi:hypothetical protein
LTDFDRPVILDVNDVVLGVKTIAIVIEGHLSRSSDVLLQYLAFDEPVAVSQENRPISFHTVPTEYLGASLKLKPCPSAQIGSQLKEVT